MSNARLAIIVAAIVFSAFNVAAQSREITDLELTKLTTEAVAKGKGIPQRVKTVTIGYTPGDSAESLFEYGPNDTYHYRTIRTSKGVETRTEGIRIGEDRYTRQKDDSWIKEPLQPKFVGTGTGSGSGTSYGNGIGRAPETTTKLRYVGSEKIRGQSTAHYRKTRTIKFTSRTVITRTVVDDYWFSAGGMLIREAHEDGFDNSKMQYKSVTDYEYDTIIHITAPTPD